MGCRSAGGLGLGKIRGRVRFGRWRRRLVRVDNLRVRRGGRRCRCRACEPPESSCPASQATSPGGRGRDRRRYEHLPDRRASGIVGGDLPGQQRVCWPGVVDRHPAREPLPESRAGRGCAVGGSLPTHLSGREVPPYRSPTRPEEGSGRCRARLIDRNLDDGPHRRSVRRSRSGLLHPPGPRTPQKTRAEPAPTPRLRRHPQPRAATT
jgi:hypothetical protein